MALFGVTVGGKKFDVVIVSSSKDMRKGLSGLDKLGKNKGMLFDLGGSRAVTMNMNEMSFSIDILFIDKEGKVTEVHEMKASYPEVSVEDARFVLEVAKGQGSDLEGKSLKLSKLAKIEIFGDDEEELEKNVIIDKAEVVNEDVREKFKKGGKISIKEDIVKADLDAMQVLDHEGNVLMNITGGERIFSREHTEKIVDLAKKIETGEEDEEALGKFISEVVEIHNTQEPQYV